MNTSGGGPVGAAVDTNVKDRYRLAQEHQKALGASANIVSLPDQSVHVAEKLLGLTTGLKQQLLLNDFATLDAGIRARVAVLEDGMESDRHVIRSVAEALAAARAAQD
ncbi:hypothetical protein HK100_004470 [Physocladia obscura]|uniref:Uncharacterized protein n=1 Tax=Physocladia obscura TaxID=109957 RepID=A0AAD5TC94_9FUNG|nr:hypothetical protein HK100_004470 [Physocladia obscura]